MEFEKIVLKPISWSVLSTLYTLDEPCKAEHIAELCRLSTRQVDAAVTKTLVRHGFCVREAQLTRLMKKEYNVVKLTDRGKRYVEWYSANHLTKENKEE